METALSLVLLIEDNPGDARLVREHLKERFGDACQLHEAACLESGLRWLQDRKPDLILLDLCLPDSHGLDTFYAVHACVPDTPVVILSGHDDDEMALDAVRAGAEDYLAKQHADSVLLARSMRHALERRKVDRALRESEARYRTIVETAGEGILQVDAARVVRFVNNRMAHLLSRPASQILGRHFEHLVDPDDEQPVVAFLAMCAPGEQRSMQVRFHRPDGGEVWMMMSAGSLHAFGSETFDIVIMLSDITGLVLAQRELDRLGQELEARVARRTAQLEAVNEELVLFNHSLAHDLRTPLNAIIGFATLLEQEPGLAASPKARHRLGMVQQGALNMGELVGAMLTLSQVERTSFQRQQIDLSAMAKAVLSELQAADADRHVCVEVEEGVTAHGDPTLVRDVIANIFGNAWKYTGQAANPRIRFGVALRSAGETVFEVQDNGVGFDMSHSAALFKPFHRLHTSKGFKGTGVGLATVHRIVQRHEGRIWAESSPGKRTSFFFTLGPDQPKFVDLLSQPHDQRSLHSPR